MKIMLGNLESLFLKLLSHAYLYTQTLIS